MASDAHAHPYDLVRLDASAETTRRELGVACAASAWNEEEFLFNEGLTAESERQDAEKAPMVLCFGVHPQLPADPPPSVHANSTSAIHESAPEEISLRVLERLVREKRIRAIGEAGFDLFDARFKATEAVQERLFRAQLALAHEAALPMVLHIRRAMHKVFAYDRELKKLPAVILHSYSGTLREALDLVKRGVNAYFSFGTAILLNHKKAMEACALLPPERLLFETDSPYQPLRGMERSTWSDLFTVIAAAARLRAAAGSEVTDAERLEAITGENFGRAYGLGQR